MILIEAEEILQQVNLEQVSVSSLEKAQTRFHSVVTSEISHRRGFFNICNYSVRVFPMETPAKRLLSQRFIIWIATMGRSFEKY